MSRIKRIKEQYLPVQWPFRMFVTLLLLAVAFIGVMLWAYRYRNDEYLARFIMEMNNKRMKGRMEIGRLHWNARALVHLGVGAPIPAVVDHFAVYDSRGERVIYIPRATTYVDLLRLLTGGDLLLTRLRVDRAYVNVEQIVGKPGGAVQVGLVEAFSSREPSTRSGRGAQVELKDFDIRDTRLKLAFSGWDLTLDRLHTEGTFNITGGDTREEGVLFDLWAKAPSGQLTIAGQPIPLKKVHASRFKVTSDRPMDLRFALTTLMAGTRVTADGMLTNTYRDNQGVQMRFRARRAGRLLSHLAGAGVGGRARVQGSIRGRLNAPLIQLQARGVRLALGPVRGHGLQGRLQLDLASHAARADGIQGTLMGGQVSATAAMDLETGHWSANSRVADIDPAPLHPLLSGKLSGTVRAQGQLGPPPASALAVVDLTLQRQRQRRDRLPARIRADGSLHLNLPMMDLAGVRLRGDGATLEARGSVNVASRRVNLHLGLTAPRLDRWLARWRLPVVARSGHLSATVTGRYPLLAAAGQLSAGGVGYGPYRVPRVEAKVRLAGDTIHLEQAQSRAYGGKLSGQADLTLFSGGVDRLRRTPTLRAHVEAAGLDLAELGIHQATGLVHGKAEFSGPLDELRGTADIRLPRLSYQGDSYDGAWARVGLLPDRVSIYKGALPRRSGGELSAWGDLYLDGRLDLRLRAAAFPLAGIPQLARLPLSLVGLIHGDVHLTGTTDNPRMQGQVRLEQTRIRGMDMGSGAVTLTAGSDTVHLKGHLLGKLLKLEGYLLTDPRARLHLRLDVTRFPVEKLLYELRELGDVRGLVTGSVRLDLDSRDGLTWADATFPELELSLRHRAPGQRKVRVVKLINQQDMLARYNGNRLHVVTARMVTRVQGDDRQQAVFTVGGWISPSQADMRLRGMVALQILEFFLRGRVKKLSGGAVANVLLTGPTSDLKLTGSLDLNRIGIQMPNFQQLIEIPHGQIKLVPGALVLSQLELRVGRQVLRATGKLDLQQFRPTTADLTLDGDLNMKLVELFFPEYVSLAAGSTWLKMRVRGPVQDPRFEGQLGVRRLELSPRGWGRTITLDRGQVAFSNYLVKTTRALQGTYDEGLMQVSGEVRLDRYDVVDLYLRIFGTGIPQRQPKVYSAELNLDLTLAGDSQQLLLSGDVELVDVRYVRKFDLLRKALFKPRISEEETPFWSGSPVLEDLALDLDVRSTGQIQVKNNVAELSLSGDFSVGGTLSDARLGGVVRVEEGTFKLPLTRNTFTINHGDITFLRTKPVDQGEIRISSETLFEGRDQIDYRIELMVEGPLSGPSVRLSSTPSMEQGQIWAMLAFGQTTDQLRANLTGAQQGADVAATGGIADAQVKQLTGEILSQIVEDPLKKVTRLDLISLEVGTESAQIRARKELGRYLAIDGEYELGLLGDSRGEIRLEFKMHDLLRLVGRWQRLITRVEAEEIDPNQGRLELKLNWPIR
jgi:autotransporter translocation and assembly factor TamB